jgi:hypothetical protein
MLRLVLLLSGSVREGHIDQGNCAAGKGQAEEQFEGVHSPVDEPQAPWLALNAPLMPAS